MSPKTAEVYAAIQDAVRSGQKYIAPVTFSACFPRASVSAAFRMAKRDGIIEVQYVSCVGTPVYQASGVNQATIEAATAVKH